MTYVDIFGNASKLGYSRVRAIAWQKEQNMTAATTSSAQEYRKPKVIYRGGASEAVYGLGLLGAWFYYLTHAATVWMGLLGIVKGIFWPAILVYEWMKFLGM